MYKFISRIIAASMIALSPAMIPGSFASSPGDPTERNLFAEYMSLDRSKIDTKIEAAWNQLFYGDDSNQRVYYPVAPDMAYILDTGNGDVRTEGMSYGMMIAVQLDHKAEFDRLWKWARTNMYHAEGSRKGYFSWQCRTDGTAIDQGSASDGEEWLATALFFASGRWGDGAGIFNYSAEANAILETMLGKGDEGLGKEKTVAMFDSETKQVRFVPLANWAKVTDPSYQLPAFYELWALWADKNNDFWAKAAAASREFFRKAADPVTGLMPDMCDFEGKPYSWKHHEIFSFDAHRAIANVALDHAWYGKDPWQAEQSERVLKFLSAYSPAVPCQFALDGKPLTEDASQSIVAMAAVGALASGRETGRIFVNDLWDLSVPTGKYRYYNGLLYMLGLLQCGGRFHVYAPEGKPDPFHSDLTAKFLKFEYSGDDRCFDGRISPSEYRNPILQGFHPDPSICKAGDDYYLVNSSFAYFPGIPICRSRNLVRWTQIGNVIDRPGQIDKDKHESSQGLFAPSIAFHDGTFYVACSLSDKNGIFYVTAQDPSGPWSDPVWFKEIEGVDPSFFFDDTTGKAYLVYSGMPPEGKALYEGHRAIWIQEFDVALRKLVGESRMIVNGGSNTSDKPQWVSGPHIFVRGEWYYLICDEGGVGPWQSEVVFRSRSVFGPWVSWMGNPILTQRDISPDRPMPVTSAGHADFVDTGVNGWWAVFQGCRPYSGDRYITGRETFLLPVKWTEDDWPVVLPRGIHVPYVEKAPVLDDSGDDGSNLVQSGNFSWSDEFTGDRLGPFWMMRGTSVTEWCRTAGEKSSGLQFSPCRTGLDSHRQPAYLGYRIQHSKFTAVLTLVSPKEQNLECGLALYQNEIWNMFMGMRRDGYKLEFFLELATGDAPNTISREEIEVVNRDAPVRMKVEIERDSCTFYYDMSDDKWTILASIETYPLTTQKAGGFVGATIGPFARVN